MTAPVLPPAGGFGWKEFRWLLYGLTALLVLIGQWQLFASNLGLGVLLTAAGLACFLATRFNPSGLRNVFQSFREPLKRLADRWERFSEAKADSPTAPPVSLASVPETRPSRMPPLPSLPEEFKSLTLKIPKAWLLSAGIILILFSQPFLYFEKFIPALAILLPGVVFLLLALFSKKDQLVLGRVETLVKFGLLALPGLFCLGLGQALLFKHLELNFPMEILGTALNAAGVLLLLALFPPRLPDPEPDDIHVLDRLSHEARSLRGVWFKAACAAAAVACFVTAYFSALSGAQLLWSLAGALCLGFSFPWVFVNPLPAPPADPVRAFVFKLGRLGIFLLALFLGYRGQSLISQEQLFPGIYHFAAAALALVLAFREPSAVGEDPGKEKPLAWPWELTWLLLILAVGIFLRTYKLDLMPYGVECDEAGAGSDSIDILKNQFSSLVVHPSGRPLFMLLSNVLAIRFLGFDSVGLRFAAMTFGVIGIFTMYLMARNFYGPRIALAAAALFAVSRWNIHFSRFGWANTLMLVLIMLGFYFLIKGLTSRRKWYFVLAGMAYALTIQTETAARMLPILCLALLVYLFATQRHFFRRNWQPLLALMLGVWLTGAGIFVFWLHKPALLYKRVYEVSIFSEDPNAPRGNYAKALLDSAKWSLTQLNWHGDFRTRHNGGLSGEPVADFWTAILFALGLGWSLYQWKRLRNFIPLLWFFGLMGASIFAIEAPQSHRAYGVVPGVFLMIAAFLDRARRLLSDTLGKWGAAAGALVFVLLLIPITKINAEKYFSAYPAFDTNVTAAAKYMGRAWPQAEHAVFTAYTWIGHWPFKLYARDIAASPQTHLYYTASDAVPYRHPSDTQAVCYTFILEYPPLLPTLRWFYPGGKYAEEVHPKYGLQYKGWGVPAAEIQRTRGLDGRYFTNDAWAGEPARERRDHEFNLAWTPATWPLLGSGSAAWDGTIFIPHEGQYTFYVSGTDYTSLAIGNRVSLSASGDQEKQATVYLAGGLHKIKIRARHATPQGKMFLGWSCTSSTVYYLYDDAFSKEFHKQPISGTHLFTYPEPVGLMGSFYASPLWKGQPLIQKIEPAVFFFWQIAPYGLTPPFSADWKGWIRITQPGDYAFDLDPATYGEVQVDGQMIVSKGIPPAGYNPRAVGKNSIRLAAGLHPVTVRWSTSAGFSLKWWWTPPGNQEPEVVPPWVLIPAEE
ncbi:MAG: hypothetical protein HGA76_01815 [Candidatus Firestonebacteria bacterium]|nr:hypothetical protein [Candidatus Firestonebacteria bacterium]